MKDEEIVGTIEKGAREADPLTKAWCGELLRIGALGEWEPWEEALIELTIEIESTLKKTREKHPLTGYDRFLIDLLRLLVLPNPLDPQSDRDKAIARLVDRARLGSDFN